MAKTRDERVPILPSTTRKGTTLSTSAALDSPSVMSKLLTPPGPNIRTTTSAESGSTSETFDDASVVLDDSGSLGPFLDATLAKVVHTENTVTPTRSPLSRKPLSDLDLEGDYIELTDEFVDACRATNSIEVRRNLFAKYSVRRDPTFATSPIYIRDKDYDFSLDLSYISKVEKEPFCGLETRTALEHMNELSALSSLFSDDQKKCMYFVAKIFPFSLKGEAKSWYDSLTPRSIRSPTDLVDAFFHKYFPASAQHAALQKIFDFVQMKEENLPESWARFNSLLRTLPGQQLPRNELLDIFYNGLTIESRT